MSIVDIESKPKVVIVDDQEGNLLALEVLLRPLGFETIRASSGRAALEYLIKNEVALVLLDVRMPVMSGYEALNEIRKLPGHRSTPIILITGANQTEAEIIEAYELGAADIIQKPIHPKILSAKASFFRELYEGNQAKESETQFRSLANSISQLAWIAHPDGHIYWYNERWYDYTGTTFDEMEGWGWDKVHHPDHVDRVVACVKDAWSKPEPWELTFPLKSKTGEYRWFLTRGVPILNSNGTVSKWFGTNTDIHDVREAQDQLKETNERLRFALLSGNLGAWRIDLKTSSVDLSPEFLEIFGFTHAKTTASEVIAKSIHPNDQAAATQVLEKALANKTAYEHEYRIVKPTGEVRWIFSRGHASYAEDGTALTLAGFAMDITARKEAEFALVAAKQAAERAKDEAERANELKSAFLANMSHEIRTPLGAMMGFADLLREPGLSTEERTNFIGVLSRNGESLSVIINDILDLSKVEAGHLTLEFTDTYPAELVEEVVSLLRVKANEKDLVLEYTHDDSSPETIVADPTRVRQILINLVGNAIKFTHFGKVKIHSFSCENDKGGRSVCFEISDTGIGIPESQKEKIFDMFVQADGSMTRRFGGTGLGLALSRKLAVEMGGDISITETKEGIGTTFLVKIEDQPEKRNSDDAIRDIQRLEPVALTGQMLSDIKILVVDDSPDNQQLIWRYLTKQGAIVESAENGLLGYRAALTGDFDIVLMDIQMPVMDGYTATQKLRDSGFRKPIIALTAHAMSEIRKKALNVGYSDHLTKPIDPTALINTIVRLSKPIY